MTTKSDQAAKVPAATAIAEHASQVTARQNAAAARLMAAGVTIYRPETCVIDPEVEVAPYTVIEPFAQLLGRTRIGAGCRIRSFSVIENCTLGNGVQIRQSCVLEDSTIADGARARAVHAPAAGQRSWRERPRGQLR